MLDKKRTAALDWEDLRYFLALTQHGSLSAAARALRVNHATVARRTASLEATLGCSLFDRRPEGYALTAEGRAVLADARAMDEAALAVLRRLDLSDRLDGAVRLTSTRVLADAFLVERMGELRRRHPGLDIEFIAEARLMSLARREADIALRLGRPKDSGLLARHAADIAYGFFAAPEWREQIDAGITPPLIGYDEASAALPEAAWLARRFHGHRVAFRSNSQTAHEQAARAGFGVAMLPRYLAARGPGLEPVEFGDPLPQRELWLLIRPDLKTVPRVRAAADFLIELFRRERAMLAGVSSDSSG